MGSGIAACFLAAGERVSVVEIADEQAAVARRSIEGSLRRMARRDEALDLEGCLARLDTRRDHRLSDTQRVVMVIEAVPENMALKQQLFSDLEQIYPPETVLASNTSSLSINEIASAMADPQRLVGMHFFNPAPVMELVEIVVGDATGSGAVESCRSWVQRLGKTSIVVQDSPGFATSRLGMALGLEAIRMVEEGVAPAADIDAAMELGYRHPMGPLKLTDHVGLDVRLAVAEHLSVELGDRFEPPKLLLAMVREGKLGRKTGEGFYRW